MYILLKRHNLDDNEKIIGIYDNKNIVIKIMNELYRKNKDFCYVVTYYNLNELDDGKIIAYLTVDY